MRDGLSRASGRISLVYPNHKAFKPGMAIRVGDEVFRVKEILAGEDAMLIDRPLWWRLGRWLKIVWAVLRG